MIENDLWNFGYICVEMIFMNDDESIKKENNLDKWWGCTLMTKSRWIFILIINV